METLKYILKRIIQTIPLLIINMQKYLLKQITTDISIKEKGQFPTPIIGIDDCFL